MPFITACAYNVADHYRRTDIANHQLRLAAAWAVDQVNVLRCLRRHRGICDWLARLGCLPSTEGFLGQLNRFVHLNRATTIRKARCGSSWDW